MMMHDIQCLMLAIATMTSLTWSRYCPVFAERSCCYTNQIALCAIVNEQSEFDRRILGRTFSHEPIDSGAPLFRIFFLRGTNYFDFNKKETMHDLFGLAKFLSQCSDVRIKLIGYSVNEGNDKATKTLGLSRANAVKKWLLSQGIPRERIESVIGAPGKTGTSSRVTGSVVKEPRLEFESDSLNAPNRRTDVVVMHDCTTSGGSN